MSDNYPWETKNGTHILPDGTIRIVIPLEPKSKKNSQQILYKKRPDGTKIPFISPSAQYKQYAKDCGIFLKPLGISYPVNVEACFFMRTRRKVDLTNLNEAIHDILVNAGVLSDDNSRIVRSTDGSRVFLDPQNPRTEILIKRADY